MIGRDGLVLRHKLRNWEAGRSLWRKKEVSQDGKRNGEWYIQLIRELTFL